MTFKVPSVEPPLLSLAVGAVLLWIAVHRPFTVPSVALACWLSEMDSPTNHVATERNRGGGGGGRDGRTGGEIGPSKDDARHLYVIGSDLMNTMSMGLCSGKFIVFHKKYELITKINDENRMK
jgi:hypothetical protein